MSDSEEGDDQGDQDNGPPRNCSSCRKEVRDGQGIQVETKHRIKRYCAKCFLKESEKKS